MRPKLLSEVECQLAVAKLPGEWSTAEAVLSRPFYFKDFKAAFQFMTEVAAVAEAMNHHPDWQQNYSVVVVWLRTHDSGGLTSLDFELAQRMEAIAAAINALEG